MVASAFAALSQAALKTAMASAPVFAVRLALSEARRTTVRIVPSVGFITAPYAISTPIWSAFARAAPSTSRQPFNPLEIPRKIKDRMTPELPLAPRRRAEATAAAISPAPASSAMRATSRAAAPMVIDIFVPVSPSGTGKTLSASTSPR